jgi:hypothetical protein
MQVTDSISRRSNYTSRDITPTILNNSPAEWAIESHALAKAVLLQLGADVGEPISARRWL